MAGTPNFLSYVTVKTGLYVPLPAVSKRGQNWVSFSQTPKPHQHAKPKKSV